MPLARGALLITLVVGSGRSSAVAFQNIQIEQVIGGVDGNTALQAIQLRMQDSGQQNLAPMRLVVRNAQGNNPVILYDFTTSVANGGLGTRVLVATANLGEFTDSPLTPDFVLQNSIPASYMVAGSLTYELDSGETVYWRLSWGGATYQGPGTGSTLNDDNGNYSPPFNGPLTASSVRALLFRFGAAVDSLNNANDYAASPGAAVFTNNSGESGTIYFPTIFGACCHGEQCTLTPLEECNNFEGEFQDTGTTCDMGLCGDAPNNDNCTSAAALGEGVTVYSTLGSTTDGPLEPSCEFAFGDDHLGSDIWYVFSPDCTGQASISLCDSNYDTKIAIYSGTNCSTTEPLICNDDHESACGEDALQSAVTFSLTAGQSYLVRIGGYVAAQGGGFINVQTIGCDEPPAEPQPPSCCNMSPVLSGDWDGDCHVDLRDFAAMQICRGRHGVNPTGTCMSDGCRFLDLNSDGRINLVDFQGQKMAWNGPVVELADCGDSASTCDAFGTVLNPEAPFGGTYYVFGSPPTAPPGYQPNANPPIPADFFGEGSMPFHGVIALTGQPIDSANLASTDTLVKHPPLRFGFGPLPVCDTVPAQVSELSLRSREPIVVRRSASPGDCNGNAVSDALDIEEGTSRDQDENGIPDDCEWYVAAELSVVGAPNGTIEACKTHGNGGVYDATVYIVPMFVFVNKAALDGGDAPNTANVRILDAGAAGMTPITFTFSDQPFSICPGDTGAYPTPCSEGVFVPGIDTSGETVSGAQPVQTTCSSHIQPGESHYFCPPTCSLSDCSYRKMEGGITGRCAPLGCGVATCGEFADFLVPGADCSGSDAAPCPQVGFFRIRPGTCDGTCGPRGTCVQFYGGANGGTVSCQRTSESLCP